MARDAGAAQVLGRADPGTRQYPRRVYGAGDEDHFTLRIGSLDSSAPFVFNCDGTAAAEDNAVPPRLDDDLEIGPLHLRLQIGARGAHPPPAAARLLAPAKAAVGAGRQVFYVLSYSRPISLPGSVTAAQSGDRSIFEVKSGLPGREPRFHRLPILGLLEEGQHFVRAPAAMGAQ